MLDISTGKFILNSQEEWVISPFLSKNDLMNSKFWDANKEGLRHASSNGRSFFFERLTIDGYPLSMEIHIGRNDYVDKITLRSERATHIQEWISTPGWEDTALEQKKLHDEFLARETVIPVQLLSEKDELSIDTDWGGITSVMDLSSEPDIHIAIRYRNLSASEKEKYLSLGRKYLHGEK